MPLITIFRRLCLAFLLFASTGQAWAEPPPGSLISRRDEAGTELDRDEAERLLQQYIRCVTTSQRGKARRLLELPYLSAGQHRIAADMMIPACVNRDVRITFRAPHIVGRVAEFLFNDRHAATDLTRFAGLSDEAAQAIGLVPRNNAEDLAFCVVRADPQGVRALIASDWYSEEHDAAIRRLTPHLAPCVAAGETLDLNAQAIRLLLAAGLYRAVTIAHPN